MSQKTIIVRANGEDEEFGTSADTIGSLKVDRSFRESFGFPDAAEFTINGAPASNAVKITEGDVISYTIRSADKGIEECTGDCQGEEAKPEAVEPTEVIEAAE